MADIMETTTSPPRQIVQLLSVSVEKLGAESSTPGSEARPRTRIATEFFKAGTTANTVCEKVCAKHGQARASMGLWLLQRKVTDEEQTEEVEDGGYITIKDSKYVLESGQTYSVMHFTGGVNIFIDS